MSAVATMNSERTNKRATTGVGPYPALVCFVKAALFVAGPVLLVLVGTQLGAVGLGFYAGALLMAVGLYPLALALVLTGFVNIFGFEWWKARALVSDGTLSPDYSLIGTNNMTRALIDTENRRLLVNDTLLDFGEVHRVSYEKTGNTAVFKFHLRRDPGCLTLHKWRCSDPDAVLGQICNRLFGQGWTAD